MLQIYGTFLCFQSLYIPGIEYCNLKQKVFMPDGVRNQRRSNLTCTASDKPEKHQGGDFILEGNFAFSYKQGGSQNSQNSVWGNKISITFFFKKT